ncbi:hypothetical protein RQP46_000758 [Phenoliferia psychrophenolica]
MATVAEVTRRNLMVALPLLALLVLAALYLAFVGSPRAARRSSQRTVLLVGPLAAGKTALFSKLLYGHVPQTHTSMKENEGTVRAKWAAGESEMGEKGAQKELDDGVWPPAHLALAHPLHLVDIPGHARLRTRALAQFLPAASGVVFTIDASSGLTGKNVRDAADHLHLVLSLLSLLATRTSSPPLPLLILLTKTDLLSPPTSSASAPPKPKSLALTLSRAKQSLARELERHRLASLASTTSAGAQLEGLEAIPQGPGAAGGVQGVLKAFGAGAPAGGEKGVLPSDEAEVLSAEAFATDGPFEWEKVEGKVEWAVGSVKGGEGGVDQVWEWIEGL